MVHQTIEGAFRQTNLSSESAEYLAKREERVQYLLPFPGRMRTICSRPCIASFAMA